MTIIKVIDMDGSQPEEPQRDFRAELAAIIAANAKQHPNIRKLQSISRKLIKITDDLAEIKASYATLHNITDDTVADYEKHAIGLGFGYAIHECHKIMMNLESELRKAKNKQNPL